MNLVTSEQKTINNTNPVRTQTCVILVTDTQSIRLGALRTYANAAQVDICAITECNMNSME